MNQEVPIANLANLKAELLAQYKSLEEPLLYAQNDFESGLIEKKREKLAKEIKKIASQIKEQANIS